MRGGSGGGGGSGEEGGDRGRGTSVQRMSGDDLASRQDDDILVCTSDGEKHVAVCILLVAGEEEAGMAATARDDEARS